jgi:16S rRNA (cytosine967-C5)-methyltransferase
VSDRVIESAPVTSREVARRVLDRVASDGAWATPALDGELARAALDDRDRRLASELVYGVLRHRARIDRAIGAHAELERTPPKIVTVLRVAAYQILLLDRVPGYAAVDDAVDAASAIGPKLGGFVNAVLRKLTANGEPPFDAPANDSMDAHMSRMEIEHSMPRWILDELAAATRAEVKASLAVLDSTAANDASVIEATTDSAETKKRANDTLIAARIVRIGELAKAFAHSAPIVARVNARRATREEVAAELEAAGVTATPIASAPMALRLEGLGDPSRDKAFLAGRWTVQDTGAQLVGVIAASAIASSEGQPSTSDATLASGASGASGTSGASGASGTSGASGATAAARILDACAGVGGKSTHLAELLDDRIAIDAADLNHTKLALGRATAVRLGLSNIHTRACDLLDPAAPLERAYDLIILDAPCTGLGVLRRHPDAKWRLGAGDVKRLAELQRMLLDAVVSRLKAGGTLVYSVCTFTRAEGLEQIAALVKRTGLELVEERRTWPPDADAFYVAVLRSRP